MGGGRPQLHHGAPGGLGRRGHRVLGPASVVSGAPATVPPVALESGFCEAGESRTTTQAAAATTAATPIRTMAVLR